MKWYCSFSTINLSKEIASRFKNVFNRNFWFFGSSYVLTTNKMHTKAHPSMNWFQSAWTYATLNSKFQTVFISVTTSEWGQSKAPIICLKASTRALFHQKLYMNDPVYVCLCVYKIEIWFLSPIMNLASFITVAMCLYLFCIRYLKLD